MGSWTTSSSLAVSRWKPSETLERRGRRACRLRLRPAEERPAHVEFASVRPSLPILLVLCSTAHVYSGFDCNRRPATLGLGPESFEELNGG
ncbi:hypothetical protein GUJ93_ZPchr0010g7973 [Zizania palustris]|uniref:Uncharacterized protein n=1 Tax=Zizania palustris TaxID=103762 RepID=A0A8J5WAC8_ZIZPA|nr:hypothetical protein GUJ93_ZPchr0010g7973 [Zizania palustris]